MPFLHVLSTVACYADVAGNGCCTTMLS